ncbi:hypothetical protein HYG81_19000 (plasmid) [Natrinema zhouii]|uniref:DUF7342 family protein n=1 Tax=Natrinema zhouii TaxID=1710539 RepID=UPI001CFF6F6E|nr:hypothetical protein [Natrinema zhouii]UHQ98189.1 hypothetical protein HYG81_19000 [Natrinema zhouii]
MDNDTTENRRRDHPSRTRGERVRTAARTLRKPRTASWVAEETEVSVKTAQKYLDQLVEDNVLRKIEQGDQTLYCIDQLMATYREVVSLQREHDREELTSALESIQTQIIDWKETYNVETSSELRASIAELEETNEIDQRREVASEWEQITDRLSVVRAALNEYDWAAKRDALSA